MATDDIKPLSLPLEDVNNKPISIPFVIVDTKEVLENGKMVSQYLVQWYRIVVQVRFRGKMLCVG